MNTAVQLVGEGIGICPVLPEKVDSEKAPLEEILFSDLAPH